MERIDLFVNMLSNILSNFGILSGILLILLESIIPILPLSVFITLNIVTYGNVLGFLISWSSTVLGCILSFSLFRSIFRDKLYKLVVKKNMKEISKWLTGLSRVSFTSFVIIIAVPFTPAFFINIASGLSKMKFQKFFWAVVIGKFVMVYFWGYIGTTLLESLTDIVIVIKIVILLLVAYLLSRTVEKKLNIK